MNFPQRCICTRRIGHGRSTQRVLAVVIDANLPAVSKLEQKPDIELSSLGSHIEAMGRKLKTVAEFPEDYVAITNFSPTEEKTKLALVLAANTPEQSHSNLGGATVRKIVVSRVGNSLLHRENGPSGASWPHGNRPDGLQTIRSRTCQNRMRLSWPIPEPTFGLREAFGPERSITLHAQTWNQPSPLWTGLRHHRRSQKRNTNRLRFGRAHAGLNVSREGSSRSLLQGLPYQIASHDQSLRQEYLWQQVAWIPEATKNFPRGGRAPKDERCWVAKSEAFVRDQDYAQPTRGHHPNLECHGESRT